MINNIKLVSSFAHRDNSNIMSNVLVKSGVMTAQNELCGISIDVESSVDFCCNAIKLNQALSCCKDDFKLSVKKDRLYISSGRFKSSISLVPVDNYPELPRGTEKISVQSDILSEINTLIGFTDPDDVRIALRGVALSGDFIKATNGHMAIKKEIEHIDIDEVIIPSKAIPLLVKANVFVDSLSVDKGSVLFHFDGGVLYTRSIDQKMPDIDRILSEIENETSLSEIEETIKLVAPFCSGDNVVMLGNEIKTKDGDTSFDGFSLDESAFNVNYLIKILEIADVIDFSRFPSPCPFKGDGVTGAIVGIKI